MPKPKTQEELDAASYKRFMQAMLDELSTLTKVEAELARLIETVPAAEYILLLGEKRAVLQERVQEEGICLGLECRTCNGFTSRCICP